jgi:hypothetical protein
MTKAGVLFRCALDRSEHSGSHFTVLLSQPIPSCEHSSKCECKCEQRQWRLSVPKWMGRAARELVGTGPLRPARFTAERVAAKPDVRWGRCDGVHTRYRVQRRSPGVWRSRAVGHHHTCVGCHQTRCLGPRHSHGKRFVSMEFSLLEKSPTECDDVQAGVIVGANSGVAPRSKLIVVKVPTQTKLTSAFHLEIASLCVVVLQ